MKGRKRNLVAIAKDGNVGKRSIKPSVSVPGDFDPPFPLGEIAMSEWNRIRAEAAWIEAPSAGALWMRCAAFEDMIKARADVAKRGRLLKTRNGAVKNPSLQIERECRAFVLRADIEFGLTSCSQQKVAAPQRPGIDPLETALCG